MPARAPGASLDWIWEEPRSQEHQLLEFCDYEAP